MRTPPIVVLGAVLLSACMRAPAARDAATASDTLTTSDLALFAPLPATFTAPDGATPTRAQVDLGRRLYYETLLSSNHNVSCNSCHPLNGYGADGRRVSFGDAGQPGGRNSPTVYNAAGQAVQFWDGRAPTVEEQAKGPVLNPAEMAMPSPEAVLAHLRAMPEYRAAFRAAFPSSADPVTYDNLGFAIGAFERGLVTPSRWDRFLAGNHAALNAQERRGAKTFVATGCTSCHNGALVGGSSMQRVGLVRPWPAQQDSGRYMVTHQPGDVFVFKVASLRNVMQTGPYFHDGSVASIDTAIRLMARHQLGKDLSDGDVADVHAFLGSLTGEIPAAYIAHPQLPAGAQR